MNLSNLHSSKAYQQARMGPAEESRRLEEKRRSLEDKTRILEEKARVEKLSIDKRLLTQILQEENRTHDAAVKELEEKIADLEQQMNSSSTAEDIQSQMPSDHAQEINAAFGGSEENMPEPAQEVSGSIGENVSVDELQQRAQVMLQASEGTRVQSEVETPPEQPTKKKKRSIF